MVVICGISAWYLHATPPAIRDLSTLEGALSHEHGIVTFPRSNANEGARAIALRLATDLKGIPVPVHLMGDSLRSARASKLIVPHPLPGDLSPADLIDLGNGLFVLSIERTLLDLARTETFVQVVQRCLEACGIYAVSAITERAKAATSALVQSYSMSLSRPFPITAYSDAAGRPLPLGDAWSDTSTWSPCVDRSGVFDGLWKRSPLTSCEKLSAFCARKEGAAGIKLLRRAVLSAHDGSGSPLESQFYLFYGLSARLGGEGWPRPFLNRRVALSEPARRIAGQQSCVADVLFPEQRGVIEVQGKRFHADRMGFEERNGRMAGLEAMGFQVFEVTYQHMARLESLELRLESIARKLDLPLARRTTAFIRRRRELFLEVFPHGVE